LRESIPHLKINNKKCINCGDAHDILDRDCSIYKKYKEIVRVMAYNNVPFLEARNLIETLNQGTSSQKK